MGPCFTDHQILTFTRIQKCSLNVSRISHGIRQAETGPQLRLDELQSGGAESINNYPCL